MENSINIPDVVSKLEMVQTTVEIDCAPGEPRPDLYFEHIWKNILKRSEEVPQPVSKFFGNWTWEVRYTKDEQSKVAEYIKDLYHCGCIRYGSW